MIHELKTLPQYYIRIFEGTKKFEIRKNDRHYAVNDVLDLREYDPDKQEYTNRRGLYTVTYILNGGQFGLEEGFVCMSIEPVRYER